MRGKQARWLRRQVYADHALRGRTYTDGLTQFVNGKPVVVYGICVADDHRRIYQDAKRMLTAGPTAKGASPCDHSSSV